MARLFSHCIYHDTSGQASKCMPTVCLQLPAPSVDLVFFLTTSLAGEHPPPGRAKVGVHCECLISSGLLVVKPNRDT